MKICNRVKIINNQNKKGQIIYKQELKFQVNN